MEFLVAICALDENPLGVLKIRNRIRAPGVRVDESEQRLIAVFTAREHGNAAAFAVNAAGTFEERCLRGRGHIRILGLLANARLRSHIS